MKERAEAQRLAARIAELETAKASLERTKNAELESSLAATKRELQQEKEKALLQAALERERERQRAAEEEQQRLELMKKETEASTEAVKEKFKLQYREEMRRVKEETQKEFEMHEAKRKSVSFCSAVIVTRFARYSLSIVALVFRAEQAAAEEKLRRKFEADMAAERKRIEAMASSSKEEVEHKAKQQMEVSVLQHFVSEHSVSKHRPFCARQSECLAKIKLEQQLNELQEKLKRQAIEDEAVRQERVVAAQQLLKDQYKAELDNVAREMEKRVQEEKQAQAAREKQLTERATQEKQQLMQEMKRLEAEKKQAEEVSPSFACLLFNSVFSPAISLPRLLPQNAKKASEAEKAKYAQQLAAMQEQLNSKSAGELWTGLLFDLLISPFGLTPQFVMCRGARGGCAGVGAHRARVAYEVQARSRRRIPQATHRHATKTRV